MAIDLEENGGADRLLRRKEAAADVTATYGFPCSPNTLAKLACVSLTARPFEWLAAFPCIRKTAWTLWARSKIGPLVRSTSEHSRHAA